MKQILIQKLRRTLLKTGIIAACLPAMATGAYAQVTTVIGTGTSATNSYGPARVSNTSGSSISSKAINLYTQSELAAAGIFPGTQISAVAWQKNNNAVLANGASVTINVSMRAQVSATTYGAGVTSTVLINNYVGTNFPVVNGSRAYTIASNFTADTAWETITLTTPFTYTGGSMEVYTDAPYTAGTGVGSTASLTWRVTTITAANTTRCMYTNSTAAYNNTTAVNIGSLRPNIKLTYTPVTACNGTPVAGTLHLDTLTACPGMIKGDLRLSGMTTAPGVSLQWQKRTLSQASFTPVTSTSPYVLEGESVTDTTLYRVIATCAASSVSDTSNILTLYPTDYIIPSYYQDFTTAASWLGNTAPACWYGRKGFMDNPVLFLTNSLGYTAGAWTSDGWRNSGTLGAARVKPNGAAGRTYDWFISPGFQLDSAHWQVEFDLGLFATNAGTVGVMDSNDVFSVVISTDGGLSWTSGTNNEYILKQFTSADSLADSTHVVIPLNSYSGSRIAIGFFCDGGLTQPATALIPDIMVDNFRIVPRCKAAQPDTISGNLLVCKGTAVTYSVTPPAGVDSFQWIAPQGWSAQGTGSSLTVTPDTVSGLIQVITHNGACDPGDTLSLAVQVSALPVLSPAGPQDICSGSTLLYMADSAVSYQWLLDGTAIPNATVDTLQVNASGSYSVIAEKNGCFDTSTVSVLTVHALPVPVIQNNNNVLSTTQSYATYQWNLAGQPINGATSATYTIASDGSYTVTVSDANGCQGTSAAVQGSTAVNNISGIASSLKLYPNPAKDILVLERSGTASDAWVIALTDLAGKTLQQHTMSGTGITLDISRLDAGIYFVKVTGKQGSHTLKVVKR